MPLLEPCTPAPSGRRLQQFDMTLSECGDPGENALESITAEFMRSYLVSLCKASNALNQQVLVTGCTKNAASPNTSR